MNFIDRYFRSPVALYEKGIDSLFGLKGKQVDIAEAFQLFTLSAETGCTYARKALEDMFMPGRPEFNNDFAGEYDTVRDLRLREEAGDPEATYACHVRCLNDENCDEYLYNKAIRAIAFSAHQDYPPALYAYACELNSGSRTPHNKELSLKYLRRSAELGYIRALHTLYFVVEEKDLAIRYAGALADDDHSGVMDLLGDFLNDRGDKQEALRLYNKAADLGNMDSMFTLGTISERGDESGPDLYNASMWYQRAADAGHVEAMYFLGNIMRLGPDEFKDPEGAFMMYQKAADAGHDRAWNDVGTCYMNGFGVQKSMNKAREAYLKAADRAFPANAYFNLYCLYTADENTRNVPEAMKWLDKSAQTGFPLACWRYGMHYLYGEGVEQDYKAANRWFKEAAKEDQPGALYELGRMYLHGVVEEQDGREAFKHFRLSADEYPPSMEMLGICYCHGIGCSQDEVKGFKCFQEAAEQGNVAAMYDLGVCYRRGEGVEPDIDKAIEWYEKAIELGHAEAMSNCALLFDKGIGVEPDLERAFKLYQMAAELGNREGQFGLGAMYYEGRGVEQDYVEAVKWFTVAAESGEPDSLYHLALCYNEGLGVEQDSFKAVQYLYEAADKGWQPALDLIRAHNIPRLDS